MVVDAHLHCSGNERRRDVLCSLDGAKVDVAILLAPYLTEPYRLAKPNSLRSANAHLATLVKNLPDQPLGFAVVNPLYPPAIKDLRDDFAHRVYERASTLGILIIFHSGIFIDGRSGRFCRPVFYEAVRDYRTLRVVLAHLGWPWMRANALGLINLINGIPPLQTKTEGF